MPGSGTARVVPGKVSGPPHPDVRDRHSDASARVETTRVSGLPPCARAGWLRRRSARAARADLDAIAAHLLEQRLPAESTISTSASTTRIDASPAARRTACQARRSSFTHSSSMLPSSVSVHTAEPSGKVSRMSVMRSTASFLRRDQAGRTISRSLHHRMQRRSLYPEARRRTARTGDHPVRALQGVDDKAALELFERHGIILASGGGDDGLEVGDGDGERRAGREE